MTRAEAEDLAPAQAREHPDRHTHRWMAKEQPDGSWIVAKIQMPPGKRIDPLKTTTEAKPRPPQPRRSAHELRPRRRRPVGRLTASKRTGSWAPCGAAGGPVLGRTSVL